MNPGIYFIKSGAALAILYLIYVLLFQRTSFYRLNRLYLLSAFIFSAVIPFIHISFKEYLIPIHADFYYGFIPEYNPELAGTQNELSSYSQFSWAKLLKFLYIIVTLAFAVRFIRSVFSIQKLLRNCSGSIKNRIFFYTGKQVKTPFTFYKWIFIPEEEIQKSSFLAVLKHEYAHARQLHSIDIILVELFFVFNWFNPFVFLFKRALMQNHEYLADLSVLKQGVIKSDYLRFMAEVAGRSVYAGIASHFYWRTMKKRIIMITKNKTHKKVCWIYILVVPLIALLAMSFSGLSLTEEVKIDKTTFSDPPDIVPIKGEYKITSGFGMRIDPISKKQIMHNAVDLAAKEGTPIIATASGTVLNAEFKKGHGNLIVIEHDDVYTTFYSHLKEFKVNTGDKVSQGDVIGLVGSSGLSTGPHLHYEVLKNGERVNPEDYFEE
ncbi:MAG: peptidoglycan DD-metalloendopeptidase family protein [Bacteroidales bacterium]|nr:peptidoglycan DD-metalloendopeptidase family protein [Bacteroidales bacterium]MBN2821473.1 peptidoglycan DD-metalloendopeptidase family protein [Bacteroidales bacterium]